MLICFPHGNKSVRVREDLIYRALNPGSKSRGADLDKKKAAYKKLSISVLLRCQMLIQHTKSRYIKHHWPQNSLKKIIKDQILNKFFIHCLFFFFLQVYCWEMAVNGVNYFFFSFFFRAHVSGERNIKYTKFRIIILSCVKVALMITTEHGISGGKENKFYTKSQQWQNTLFWSD